MSNSKEISASIKIVFLYFLFATLVSSVKNEFFLARLSLEENVFFAHVIAHLSSMISILIDLVVKVIIFSLSYYFAILIAGNSLIEEYIYCATKYFFLVLIVGEFFRLFLVLYILKFEINNFRMSDLSGDIKFKNLVYLKYSDWVNRVFIFLGLSLGSYNLWEESDSTFVFIVFFLVSAFLFSIYLFVL